MITTIVQFTLAQPMTRDEARKVFQSTAPKYRGLPGLVRKYYIVADDGRTAGGVYLWNSRADAQAVYTDEWRAFVTGKYGSPPSLSWFETPVVVDNLADAIIDD
jgi:hypothetical protein